MSLFSTKKLQEIKARTAVEKKHTIMIVDDEQGNLTSLSNMLQDKYHLLQAQDGQEAFETISSEENPDRINLIISDQRMPRMTGVELFEKVISVIPKAKRIILTGYTDVGSIIDSVNKAQIYQFILKPVDRNDLLITVERALEAYVLEEKVEEYQRDLEKKILDRTRELEQKNNELESAYRKLEEVSLTDPLTGLRNRRYLIKYIDGDIAKICRTYEDWRCGRLNEAPKDSDLVFILVDLDRFKRVNDTYGHAAGDRVLVQMREILENACRKSDILVRWGGEEFLVVTRYTSREHAEVLAERIRSMVEEHAFDIGNNQSIRATCSLGMACYPFLVPKPDLLSWEQVVDVADQCLYAAKKSGRNAWVGAFVKDSVDTGTLPQKLREDLDGLIERNDVRILSSFPQDHALTWQ